VSARARSVAFAAVLLLLAAGDAHAQCALCRESLAKSGNGGLIQGIYVSIVMLTFAPTALVAGIGLLLRRAYREKQKLVAHVKTQEPTSCVQG
jgi:hypothetical protein